MGSSQEFYSYNRSASHAGSWYTDDHDQLHSSLQDWLGAVEPSNVAPVRALIGPHAGFSYSGPTAAYAYRHMEPDTVQTVIVLGPSHHVYLRGAAISMAEKFETPLYDMEINKEVSQELLNTGLFEVMTQQMDEDEHSLEMHLPYIAKMMEGRQFKVVCLMIGATSKAQEEEYGRVLAPYLDDPQYFFVISSDFCHWGQRFRYQPYEKSHGQIHEYITWLDHQGMQLIEAQDCDGFLSYLEQTQNTICGRHPISVLLFTIKAASTAFDLKFLKYAQSSSVSSRGDSSVSYASAVVTALNDS
mmetsp:Transcript_4246/g.5865  ORF Transcript_4246/g.5865 Transcript_4246/m.5865 type:complete len:301 (-) Transcript_4246:88-990(-)